MENDLKHLDELYDLELDRVVREINKKNAKLVLLQFPDGLKPYATSVVDYLGDKTGAEFLIWFGSCYGACDTPLLGKSIEKEIDLIFQFGHNELIQGY